MKINAKTCAFFFSMIACIGIGALSVYLPNKDAIKLSENMNIAFEIDGYLQENGIQPKEIDENDYSLVNKYLELRYDKYTKYSKSSYDSGEYIIELVNNAPTALGSGFQLNFDENDNLVFSEVLKDSWAEQQGLMKNDIIKSIDGVSVSENGYETAKKISGKNDTECSLEIDRKGKIVNVNFKRKNVDSSSFNFVSSEKIGDTLYLSIKSIGGFTDSAVKEQLEKNKFDSVILDLRNNGGGHTYVSTSIADMFLSEGYTTEHYYLGDEHTVYMKDEDSDIKVPIVILTNGKTASAAETLTGLLKQNADTTIIGTNTFGKGIFQSSAAFKGGYLRYTDGYFTVGDWDCWHGKGIAPDIEVQMDYDENIIGTDKDIQLQKALEILG